MVPLSVTPVVKGGNMDDDKRGYQLTQKGLIMMLKILLKAEEAGLYTPGCINEANVKDYVQTLADHDEIWEGSQIEEVEQRLVMLAMLLLPMVNPTADKSKLN